MPSVSSVGQLKTFLVKQGGLSNEEANAIVENATGKGVLEAMKDNHIYDKKAKPSTNTTMFGYRFSKAFKSIIGFLMLPVLEAQNEETQLQAQIDLEKAIKDWEKRGCVGRKPGQKNSAKRNPLNSILKESIAHVRKNMGIDGRGRVPYASMIELDTNIREDFASKLKAYSKENELSDTIENLVKKMIEPVDTTKVVLNEIKIAAKEADRHARASLEIGSAGRISGDNVAPYNKEAKTNFRESLKTIKETYGHLPASMDDLTTQYLWLYTLETEAEIEAKGKDKGKKEAKKPKGGKAKNVASPVVGEVVADDANDEADANAAVTEAVAEAETVAQSE